MINISGKVVEPSSIKEIISFNNIINIMGESKDVYKYDSLNELKFEVDLRTMIIGASKELDNSKFSFAVFRKSKCNKNFWTRSDDGGFSLNKDVKSSEAINDIFTNGSEYATECATAIVILYYKSLLNVFGEEIFNQIFSNIHLMNWHYLDSKIGISSYYIESIHLPGDCVYFKNPDVNPLKPEWQGENAIDLGDGTYFGHGIGINTAEEIINSLNDERKRDSNESAFLTKSVTSPDFKQLAAIYYKFNPAPQNRHTCLYWNINRY